MRTLFVIFVVLFIILTYSFFFKPIFQTKKQYAYILKIYELFLSDYESLQNDAEFEKWINEMNTALNKIVEDLFSEKVNKKLSEEIYCFFKEYNEWRKQKLK